MADHQLEAGEPLDNYGPESGRMQPLGPGNHVTGVQGPIDDVISAGTAVERQEWTWRAQPNNSAHLIDDLKVLERDDI